MNDTSLTLSPGLPAAPRPGRPGIEQRLSRDWKRLGALPGAVILLAFSGGPDSSALGLALTRVAQPGDFRVEALHVDHRLRPESASEATTAMQIAKQVGLDCHVATLDADPTHLHPGVGVEEAARRERYLALARHAGEVGAMFVATAHHVDDQAETVMLHLLRGAGLGGVSGMASLSELVVPWWSADSTPRQTIRLWRPWLREGKHEIATYRQAVAPALEPVVDMSNTGDAMLRNRLRHHLMPLLDELRPGATGALARFAELAAADDQLLNEIALAATSEMDRTPDGLPIAELAQLPLPLLRRAVRREMVAYGAASDVSAERVDALIQAVRGGRGNVTIEIGSGLRTSVAGGRLRFESSGTAG